MSGGPAATSTRRRLPSAAGWLLRLYRRAHALEYWLERRFTPLGRLVLGAALVSGLFALDVRRTQAYQLFAVLAALLLVSFVLSLAAPRLPRVERRLPALARAGQVVDYRLVVHGDASSQRLWLHDQVRAAWPDAAALRRSARTSGSRLPWFAHRHWWQLWRRQRGAQADGVEAAVAGPTAVAVTLYPLRRGHVHLHAVQVGRSDPLGLCRAVRLQPLAGHLLVLPQQRSVRLLVSAGGAGGRPGAATGRRGGGAEEILGLREYRPGDPVRHVHWRAWARHGQPLVREFQDAASDSVAVLLDQYGGRGGEPLFEAAVSVAAALVEQTGRAGSDVTLFLAGQQLDARGAAAARPDLLLAALACVEGADEAALAVTQAAVLARRDALRRVYWVTTRHDRARRALLRALAGAGLHVHGLLLEDVPAAAPRPLEAVAGVSWQRLPLHDDGPVEVPGW